jgi:hypothetical protein
MPVVWLSDPAFIKMLTITHQLVYLKINTNWCHDYEEHIMAPIGTKLDGYVLQEIQEAYVTFENK